MIRLGESASRMLGSWAMPYLVELVDTFGETTNMAMLDGDACVYVAQVPSPQSMRMFTEVGRFVMPHCTGVGKAILSTLPDHEVRALLGAPACLPRTEHTITSPDGMVDGAGGRSASRGSRSTTASKSSAYAAWRYRSRTAVPGRAVGLGSEQPGHRRPDADVIAPVTSRPAPTGCRLAFHAMIREPASRHPARARANSRLLACFDLVANATGSTVSSWSCSTIG